MNMFFFFVLIIIGLLVIMSVLWSGLHRQKVQIKKIIAATQRMTEGNWNAGIIIPGNGLVSQLGDAVNRLAEKIQTEQTAASRRETAYRQSVTNISHDIRTPLTSLVGYLEAVQGAPEADRGRYQEIAYQMAKELAGVIEDPLFLARIESGELILKLGPVDLAEIMRQAVLAFAPNLEKRDWEVHINIPEHICLITGDKTAMRRVFNNLISNTLRHTENATQFGVDLKIDGARFIARIWDNGLGIAEAERAKLFERSYIAVPTHGGTGLGLTIAREILLKHNGTLDVESSARGLTEFIVTLPRTE